MKVVVELQNGRELTYEHADRVVEHDKYSI